MTVDQAVRAIVDQRLTELGLISPIGGPVPTPAPASAGAALTHCFKCGAEGTERRNGTTGETFWVCPIQHCGFHGRDGKFVRTSWNASNWQERKTKHEQFAARSGTYG